MASYTLQDYIVQGLVSGGIVEELSNKACFLTKSTQELDNGNHPPQKCREVCHLLLILRQLTGITTTTTMNASTDKSDASIRCHRSITIELKQQISKFTHVRYNLNKRRLSIYPYFYRELWWWKTNVNPGIRQSMIEMSFATHLSRNTEHVQRHNNIKDTIINGSTYLVRNFVELFRSLIP